MLVSSSLVQIGWEPRVLPYLVLLVLIAILFAGAYWMPEPVLERSRFRPDRRAPQRPPVVRRPFVLAALAVLSSWSIGGALLLARPATRRPPARDDQRARVGDRHRRARRSGHGRPTRDRPHRPWIAASAGSVALAAGMVMIVAAAATDSSALYLAGSIVGGAGFGAAFLGGLRALVAAIPPEHRAAVAVGVLRRRLRVALGARRPRRRRRHLHLACDRPSRSSAASSPRSRSSSPSKRGARGRRAGRR